MKSLFLLFALGFYLIGCGTQQIMVVTGGEPDIAAYHCGGHVEYVLETRNAHDMRKADLLSLQEQLNQAVSRDVQALTNELMHRVVGAQDATVAQLCTAQPDDPSVSFWLRRSNMSAWQWAVLDACRGEYTVKVGQVLKTHAQWFKEHLPEISPSGTAKVSLQVRVTVDIPAGTCE